MGRPRTYNRKAETLARKCMPARLFEKVTRECLGLDCRKKFESTRGGSWFCKRCRKKKDV